jgi:hypothetical protein
MTPLPDVRRSLLPQIEQYVRMLVTIARHHIVVRRPMTVPGLRSSPRGPSSPLSTTPRALADPATWVPIRA